MATAGAIGKRRALAIQRIQKRCTELGGEGSLTIPTYTRHGQDMLVVFQLEAIADYLDTVPTVNPPEAIQAARPAKRKAKTNA